MNHRPVLTALSLICLTTAASRAELTLVDSGQARVALVLPAESLPVERYAADELVWHVARITGVTLPVMREGAAEPAGLPAGRLYLGATQAASDRGLRATTLQPDEYRLLVAGQTGFILGGDSDGPPLDANTKAGTLFGVYEVLDADLGVRWLWPGDLGTVTPARPTAALAERDEQTAPWLIQRRLRPVGRQVDDAKAFTDEELAAYRRAEAVFLRRHRMGNTVRTRYGHAFERWWERSGEAHPEWFQLLPDGRRGPERPGSRYSMCVADPGFRQQVIDEWLAARAAAPGEFINLNGCENDISGRCTCPLCEAWDGPQPPAGTIPDRFTTPKVVSDRYARFWLELQQAGVQHHADAAVIGYAYVNYFLPPSPAVTLNDRVWVGFVPDLNYPRDPATQEWFKDQWQGWADRGAKLFLRPNYFLDGYAMPHIYAHQFAESFQFYAQHGMHFTDFDSLTGQWAAQGTNLYLLARLHVRPEQEVEALLGEYYQAFGAAAPEVKAYFDYWEQHTAAAPALADMTMGRFSRYAGFAHRAFPPESFAPATALLDQAAAKVAGDPEASARVAFLRAGCDHALLCVQAGAMLAGESDDFNPVAANRAVADVVAFRRAHAGDMVGNFSFLAYVEERSWAKPSGYGGEPLAAVVADPAPTAEAAPFPTRGRHSFVALLRAGETFRAELGCRRVGRNETSLTWRLFGPSGQRLEAGEVAVGTTAEVAVAAPADGVYLLLTNAAPNAADVVLHNDHAALAETTLRGVDVPTIVYLALEPTARRLAVKLFAPAPGETATLTVTAPSGEVVFTGACEGNQTTVEFAPELAADHGGGVWALAVGKAGTGVFEDFTLTVTADQPVFLATAPDRLVRAVQ